MIALDNNILGDGSEKQMCNTKTKHVDKNIPQPTADKMNCIWRSNTGNNSELWDLEWQVWGSCTDLKVEEYFQLATDKFTQFSPNVRACDVLRSDAAGIHLFFCPRKYTRQLSC